MKYNQHAFRPGTLLKINSEKWGHVGLVPLDQAQPDLRLQGLTFLDTDFINKPADWIYNKLSPPILYLGTIHSPISPDRRYRPMHLDREIFIHKFLHLGKIWIYVTRPDSEPSLIDIFVEAKPENRSMDRYFKKHFGDLYNPTDWEDKK